MEPRTTFGHEQLHVYKMSIEYVRWVFDITDGLEGRLRHARDQWLRAAQSIPLNIAEGNGRSGQADRRHFFDIARGSALECAAIQDVVEAGGKLDVGSSSYGKNILLRVVSMLTKMGQMYCGVQEGEDNDYDYDYDKDGEYEEKRVA